MSSTLPEILLKLLVATLPVTAFLLGLLYLDSYKLVGLRAVLRAMLLGAAAAAASYAVNSSLVGVLSLDVSLYSRYGAPFVEELAKCLPLLFLIRRRRVGFLVDAAIFGFALGTGFALVENLYYLHSLAGSRFATWIIRGFGTAVMHAGATGLCGILSKLLAETHSSEKVRVFLPGLLAAVAVHSFYNHFLFSPAVSTAAILLVLPPSLYLVFRKSERTLQHWLGVGFDTDVELLRLLHSGEFSDSRIGRYLHSLTEHFRGEAIADMLCCLRIHLELAIRAKGAFLLTDSGFSVEMDEETRAKFAELEYLERQIGRTGLQAISPFISARSHDFWQLYRLQRG